MHAHPFGEFVVSGGVDTHIKIWDVRKKACIQTYKGHAAALACVRFSPDGRWVASTSDDGKAKLWDLTTGPCCIFFSHACPVRDAVMVTVGSR